VRVESGRGAVDRHNRIWRRLGTKQVYDNNGNLISVTDNRGVIKCFGTVSGSTCQATAGYGYDALNRPLHKNYYVPKDSNNNPVAAATPSVTWGYDTAVHGTGYLRSVTATNSSGVVQSVANYPGYDSMGRVTGSSQSTGGILSSFGYTYNLGGRLETQTLQNSSRTLTYCYDDVGRVASATGTLGGRTTRYAALPESGAGGYSYAANGSVQQMTLGNNLLEETCFNNRLQPRGIRVGSASTSGTCIDPGTDLLNLGFSYGSTGANNGNVSVATIVARPPAAAKVSVSQAFTYDALNRLKTAGEAGSPGWQQLYVYDPLGNRALLAGTQYYIPGGNWTPQVTADDPTQVAPIFPGNRWSGAGVQYDVSGNSTALPGATNPWSFAYDGENRQTSATNPSGGIATYVYDGDGRRVQKVSGTAVTTYAYDAGGQLAAEYSASAPTAPCLTCYLTADHLGSTRMVTDGSGAIESLHDYLPFGEEIQAGIGGRSGPSYPGNDGVTQKFTGKERDVETGLDWFKVRYMGSAQGRFTSPDPFSPIGLKRDKFEAWISNPQRWNKYAYALNNPLAFIDPTGMNACGTNDDSTCKVTVRIAPRSKDEKGHYNDQFTGVKNQKGYNATATVFVNGNAVGTFLAKTTPSSSTKYATISEGTYSGGFVLHKGQYPAIGLLPDLNIPTVGPNPSRTDQAWKAEHIHIHKAGLDNFTGVGQNGKAVSEGCTVIARDQYEDFQAATGLTTSDGSQPQQHFTVSEGAPENAVYADPVLPEPGTS